MGQIFFQDNMPEMVRASATTATLASTKDGQPTRLTVGGQQYAPSAILTLNTALTGFGGLDTGTISNTHSLYYVYAVIQAGVLGLICSLAAPSTGPAGFTSAYKLVGAFYSKDSGNQIGSMVTITGTAETEWTTYTATLTNTGAKTFTVTALWKRQGDQMLYKMGAVSITTASGSAASDAVALNWPFAVDPNKLAGAIGADASSPGTWWANGLYTSANAINNKAGMVMVSSTTANFYRSWDTAGYATTVIRIGDLNVARIVGLYADGSVPVSGWSKTLL